MENLFTTLKMDEVTEEYDPSEIESQKGMAIVAYLLCFLFFLPIVSNKESLYAKKVANQSLTMLIYTLVNNILIGKVLIKIPFLSALIYYAVGLALVVLLILKIVDAVNGKVRNLPFNFEISAFK